MPTTVEIRVCKKCGWTRKKVRKAIESLVAEHDDRILVRQKGCLDSCKKDPCVIVGRKLLAPAKPKKIRKAVEKRLAVA